MIDVKIYTKKSTTTIPAYATEHSSGVDLCADIEKPIRIWPNERKVFPTDIYVRIPEGYEGQVRGRSGLAFKHGISLTHGVGTIDADYTGEIKVNLVNHGDNDYTVNPGDRIAQLIFCPIVQANFIKIDTVEELGDTVRGAGGFGSTGFGIATGNINSVDGKIQMDFELTSLAKSGLA